MQYLNKIFIIIFLLGLSASSQVRYGDIFVLKPKGSEPAFTTPGALYYNVTDGNVYKYNGLTNQYELLGGSPPQTLSTNNNPGNISISDGNTLNLNINDADSSTSNELQTISSSGTNRTLSLGGGTFSVADNDNSSSNEIQSISRLANNISLSNSGGTVSIDGANAGLLDGLDSSQFLRSDVDDLVSGILSINRPGQDNVFLRILTERPWRFKQIGTGGATALGLFCENEDKLFIIGDNQNGISATSFNCTSGDIETIGKITSDLTSGYTSDLSGSLGDNDWVNKKFVEDLFNTFDSSLFFRKDIINDTSDDVVFRIDGSGGTKRFMIQNASSDILFDVQSTSSGNKVTGIYGNNDQIFVSNAGISVNSTQGGIKYSADYSANYTDRSLVDRGFVEGLFTKQSFTPVLEAGNNQPYSYASATCSVTKSGNIAFLVIVISGISSSGSTSGQFSISGIPFPVNTISRSRVVRFTSNTLNTETDFVTATLGTNEKLTFIEEGQAVSASNLSFSGSGVIMIYMTYETDL